MTQNHILYFSVTHCTILLAGQTPLLEKFYIIGFYCHFIILLISILEFVVFRYLAVTSLKELLQQMQLCRQQTVLVSWMVVLIW